MEKFIVIKDSIKRIPRYNYTRRSIDFKLKAVPEGEEPIIWVKDAVNQIIRKGTEGLQGDEQVGFSFCSKDFSRGEGWLRMMPAKRIKIEDVWLVISNLYQSNTAGLSTESFCLKVTIIQPPAGQGRVRTYNSFNEECKMRKGIIAIQNSDNLCLPRALVVALANINKDRDFDKIRRDAGKIQTQKAKVLMERATVNIPLEGAGVTELDKFQEFLKEYKIIVYRYGSRGRDIMFEGLNESNKRLNLLYHDKHFCVLSSLTSAFVTNYFCEPCRVPYDHKNKHRCVGATCPGCLQAPKCKPDQLKIKCDKCHRYFRGEICYRNHITTGLYEKNKSVCEEIRQCTSCFKTVKSRRDHTCGEIFCKTCSAHMPANHLCFMKRDTGTPKTKDVIFLFYDLETRQEEVLENGDLLHEPNLCVFLQNCSVCINSDVHICKRCHVRLQVLKGSDPIGSFVAHLLQLRKKFKEVIVLSHNSSGFDTQFALRHILTETDLTPELIMRGTKVIMMKIANIKFIDSLNYFPMALAKLPQAFGFASERKKGYFPYLFNTKANEKYVGIMPSIENYGPDNMKEAERTKFIQWYNKHKNDQFDLQKELVDYCVSDVQILAKACLIFREQLISKCSVCPYTEGVTIAGVCNRIYRRKFLKPNTIGIIPKNGYRRVDQQSQIALEWLIWSEHQRQINIQHAAKGREAVLQGLKVDGFCAETNEIFEFQGCYYHGCIKCYKFDRHKPLSEDPSTTLNLRYEAARAKISRLKEFGYIINEMWECDFRRLLKDCPEINVVTKTNPLMSMKVLNPRDAFYGGRTGNVWTHYSIKDSEVIKYVDVTSLYPWICKNGVFPVGHAQVIVGDDCLNIDVNSIEGLIKCKVLPPKNLYHPVLPMKLNSKLMFGLCKKCMEEMYPGDCNHDDEQRAFEGTWVSIELKKAVEMGYTIINISEIWKYNTVMFNKERGVEGLFTLMMNEFLKIKQESSGWPKECLTDESKYKYIEEFLEKEDIRLEYDQIIENPGLRSLAKLILNSFWGKFGQRENQPKTKIINNPAELFTLLNNPGVYVNGLLPINDKTLIVSYEHIEEAYDPSPIVNVAIAAYVTAQARLKLYTYLEKLGNRVLYYDTDSVIYVTKYNEDLVPTGQFIGDLTDELEGYGPGSYITDFVSSGPKNYAFKLHSTNTNSEEVVCKVKGLSLTYNAAKLVNFDSIKNMVLQETEPIPIISNNICRSKEHVVTTRKEVKHYRPNSTKRKFSIDGSSVPYGIIKKKKLNV